MGCDTNTADSCLACFNWGSGSIGARALISALCTTAITTALVTDCKFYSGFGNGTTQSLSNCSMCNKDFINQNANTTTVTCSNTAANTTTCTGKIDNCLQTACYTADGTTYVNNCNMCIKNYAGTGTATGVGWSSCAASTAITNCEYQFLPGASTNACYSCKSNYAVASTSLTCSAYTTDGNCRQLDSSGDCAYCWHAYYFNISTCKLTAFMTAISMMSLTVLALFQ